MPLVKFRASTDTTPSPLLVRLRAPGTARTKADDSVSKASREDITRPRYESRIGNWIETRKRTRCNELGRGE
jgi:hypothetical protein